MKLVAKQDFSWAHQGVRVEEFKAGQEIETEDQDLIQVATQEGWLKAAKAPANKAMANAPENKSAAAEDTQDAQAESRPETPEAQ